MNEEKLLKLFQEKEKVNTNNLLVSIPDCFENDNEYIVMEKAENGKVWNTKLNNQRTKVIKIIEVN